MADYSVLIFCLWIFLCLSIGWWLGEKSTEAWRAGEKAERQFMEHLKFLEESGVLEQLKPNTVLTSEAISQAVEKMKRNQKETFTCIGCQKEYYIFFPNETSKVERPLDSEPFFCDDCDGELVPSKHERDMNNQG